MKEKSTNLPQGFCCEICNIKTHNKKDYEKHLLTAKHQNRTILNGIEQKIPNKQYICNICSKIYSARNSLWYHQKKCNISNNPIIQEDIIFESNEKETEKLINYLIKENSEFKQLLIEQNKQMLEQNMQMLEVSQKTNNINNINSNNTNSFNLNVFLNETCKNAMNIMDFVSQLEVGIKDLEETGRLGFAEGISKIFINGLKQIDIIDRPIHCSDFKRETLYIKDKNQWSKDNEQKTLTNAIKHVAHKNMKQISEWTKTHSDFNDSSSKENDKYLKIVSEAMSGSTQEETYKNYNKIIKNIVKETIIDK
jgi:hypothetical protein